MPSFLSSLINWTPFFPSLPPSLNHSLLFFLLSTFIGNERCNIANVNDATLIGFDRSFDMYDLAPCKTSENYSRVKVVLM